ncbi:hypothetical protein B0181_05725 [Moraxella caviae]|uniref:Uncharacterized protein n=1 Tax=Moraxella caviae TaxID=34060 RepID=A0A1T0A3J3_9GAMM|nr:hypothetical protein B0181_05725 [Moraxella caviae]
MQVLAQIAILNDQHRQTDNPLTTQNYNLQIYRNLLAQKPIKIYHSANNNLLSFLKNLSQF